MFLAGTMKKLISLNFSKNIRVVFPMLVGGDRSLGGAADESAVK